MEEKVGGVIKRTTGARMVQFEWSRLSQDLSPEAQK
jgi:hypothetical protein